MIKREETGRISHAPLTAIVSGQDAEKVAALLTLTFWLLTIWGPQFQIALRSPMDQDFRQDDGHAICMAPDH